MKRRIELSQGERKRLASFQAQIVALRQQVSLLEQGVHAMLVTILEERGVEDGVAAILSDDGAALEIPGGDE